MKKRSYGTVIGALVYVFSGFCFRLGLRHPFFINPMIYFPLLCLGIEKIYQRERPYVFIFAVCVSAMSNYYFLYMLTIFAVIYAWIRFYKYTEENKMINVIPARYIRNTIMKLYIVSVFFGETNP